MVSQKHQQPERSYTAGNMDGARPLVTAAGGESTDGRISQLEATIQALVAEREQLLAQAQALRTAAEARATQLQAVFDAMADAVFIYDAQGQITEMNAAARELFGLPSSPEYAALPLDRRVSAVQARDEQGNTLPPDEWPQRRILRGEVLKGPTSVDVRIHTLDGHEIQFNQSGAPLYNSGGRIVGGVAVCRDMTERRQLELRTHEALSALLAIAELFVAETDAPAQAGGPAAIDPAVMGQRIAELTARVLGCQRVALLVADQPGGAIRPLATVGLSPDEEERWRAGDPSGGYLRTHLPPELARRFLAGEVLLLDYTQPPLSALPNPHGLRTLLLAPMRVGNELVGALNVDFLGAEHIVSPEEVRLTAAVAQLAALVVERDRLLRERAQVQASELALREANRRMDVFLGIASHELRTPLTTIKANIQLAEQRLRLLAPAAARTDPALGRQVETILLMLQRSAGAADRQERLADDLLDVSRLQEDRLELRLEPLRLAPLVAEVVDEIRASEPERVILYSAPRRPAHVRADGDRIRQVLTNYLTNAIKYSPPDVPVEVRLAQEDDMVRISVRDHGAGIPHEEQPHLFERFYRVPGIEVQSGSGLGLGLGLYISRTIVERHGGQVGVESAPGQGSTFWFTLPLLT